MKNIFLKHTVISYYILTLIVSLLLLIPHIIYGTIITPSLSLTQFAPAISVCIFSIMISKKSIFIDCLKKFKFQKIFNWILFILVLNFTIIFSANLILTYLGQDFSAWKGDIKFYVLETIFLLIGCIGEEIGWRGFLLSELNKKYTLLKSSIIVGILWGIWHLNFVDGILGFVLFTISLIFNSIFISWIYVKSNKNLTLVVFDHFCFNLFSHIFLWNRFSIGLYIIEIIIYAIISIIVIEKSKNMFLKNIV